MRHRDLLAGLLLHFALPLFGIDTAGRYISITHFDHPATVVAGETSCYPALDILCVGAQHKVEFRRHRLLRLAAAAGVSHTEKSTHNDHIATLEEVARLGPLWDGPECNVRKSQSVEKSTSTLGSDHIHTPKHAHKNTLRQRHTSSWK